MLLDKFIEEVIKEIWWAVQTVNNDSDYIHCKMPEYIDLELKIDVIKNGIEVVDNGINFIKLRIETSQYPYNKNNYKS